MALSSAASCPPLKVKKLHPDAQLPRLGSELAAGFDLASVADEIVVRARGVALIPTGLAVQLPPSTYGRLAGRSSLALKHSIGVGGGVIDEDYRGEIGVILFNHSPTEDFTVEKGDRIAQLIVQKIERPTIVEVTTTGDSGGSDDDDLTPTARGGGGFGSTGRH